MQKIATSWRGSLPQTRLSIYRPQRMSWSAISVSDSRYFILTSPIGITIKGKEPALVIYCSQGYAQTSLGQVTYTERQPSYQPFPTFSGCISSPYFDYLRPDAYSTGKPQVDIVAILLEMGETGSRSCSHGKAEGEGQTGCCSRGVSEENRDFRCAIR